MGNDAEKREWAIAQIVADFRVTDEIVGSALFEIDWAFNRFKRERDDWEQRQANREASRASGQRGRELAPKLYHELQDASAWLKRLGPARESQRRLELLAPTIADEQRRAISAVGGLTRLDIWPNQPEAEEKVAHALERAQQAHAKSQQALRHWLGIETL